MDIPAAQARIQRLMADEGLDFGKRERTYNSRLAQELACYAETQPHGKRIHDRLFRAYFVEGMNLAVIDNLVQLGVDIGLEKEACHEVLAARSFRTAVDADWRRARTMQLNGVPAFLMGEQGVVGAQPYEVLEQLLRQAGARRRDSDEASGNPPSAAGDPN